LVGETVATVISSGRYQSALSRERATAF